MSDDPNAIVAQELRKQELAKAVKHAALGEILKRLKRFRKTLKRNGQNGGLSKTYVDTVGGYLNDLAGQIASLQAAFTPAVAAGMPQYSGRLQPDETTGGGSGDMVTDSPSDSGEGAMVEGAGTRKAVKGKGLKKLKKLVAQLVEDRGNIEKRVVESVVALLKPPTPEEAAKIAAAGGAQATGGAPVRLVKDAADAAKVVDKAAGGAADDEPSEAVIRSLQEKANDASDPVGAAKASAELRKLEEVAVRKAILTTAQEPVGQPGFRALKKA